LLIAMRAISHSGANRLPIMEGHKLTNVMTLSAVVTFLAQNLKALGAVAKLTVGELNVGLKEVFTVQADTPVINAFRLMAQKRISAVGVLDTDGKLLTNVSAKDIKVIAKDALFTKLYYSTIEFVRAVRAQNVLVTYAAVMHCKLENTIGDVIQKFASWKVHRIYITDHFQKPIGVISLKDILNAVLQVSELKELKEESSF